MTEPTPPRLSTGFFLMDTFTPAEVEQLLRGFAHTLYGQPGDVPETTRDLAAQAWNAMHDLDAVHGGEDAAAGPPGDGHALARQYMTARETAGDPAPAVGDAVAALTEAVQAGGEEAIVHAYGVAGLALYGLGSTLGLDLSQAMTWVAAKAASHHR